jgi:hypothetical protein
MQKDTRGFLGVVLSLALAAGVALGLAHLKEVTEKRPRPARAPVAKAR